MVVEDELLLLDCQWRGRTKFKDLGGKMLFFKIKKLRLGLNVKFQNLRGENVIKIYIFNISSKIAILHLILLEIG